MLGEVEQEAKGCPFDGEKPVWESERAGMRDEPYRIVRLRCPKCGVSKSRVLSDAQESQAGKLSFDEKLTYPEAAVRVARIEALRAWNTRHI